MFGSISIWLATRKHAHPEVSILPPQHTKKPNTNVPRALVFAAALIPGFSMFSQKELDSTLEEAFNGALEILRFLSHQSAQAAHYFEILNLLRNAIDEQRQRLRENPPPDKKYVSKLFSLNGRRNNNSSQSQRGTAITTSLPEPDTRTSELAVQPLTTPTVGPLYPGPEDPDPALFDPAMADVSATTAEFPGWEGMDLPLWDRFPFIDDSFLN